MHLAGSLRSEKAESGGGLEHLPGKQDFMSLFSSFSMSKSTDKPRNTLILFTSQLEILLTHQSVSS